MTPIEPTLRRGCAALAAGLLASLLSAGAHAADSAQFSRAETLVFADRHLANIKTSTMLRYDFVKSGSLEPGFTDTVSIDVKPSGKADFAVTGSFLTGERQQQTPVVPEAEANPVILYFLERDIREMQRLTKGRMTYFQKRIRMAMAEDAQVQDTKITYNGREFAAQQVTLSPYAKDPARARYDRYADKRYTFVLCKDVPGSVYQIRTSMGGSQPTDPVMIEEVMTLAGTEAGTASAAGSNTR